MALALYDKQRVAQHFGRAAATYNRYNQLQKGVSNALIEQLQPADALLDAGCGPGVNVDRLRTRSLQYLGVDISQGMLQQARQENPGYSFAQADIEALPLATASFDALYSSLAVQWCNRPENFLREAARVVKPGGQIVFSTVLADSLQPLASCWEKVDGHAHTNPQRSMSQWREQIASTPGLHVEHMAQRRFTVFSDTLVELLQGIRGVGANYQVSDTTPGLSRQALRHVAEVYERYRLPAGLPLHYEIGLFNLRCRNN
jgi:malonyl-CoA O-methyltransferase